MIVLRLRKRKGFITRIYAEGHSGYAPEGSDIVCAGVSALMQTLEIGFSDVLAISPLSSVDERRGYLSLEVPHADERTEILFQTIIGGLRAMEESYPAYLEILEAESDEKI